MRKEAQSILDAIFAEDDGGALRQVLAAGANPNVRLVGSGAALHRVAMLGLGECESAGALVKILVSHGADVELRADFMQGRAWTPLHLAASEGSVAAARALVAAGADLEAETGDGDTALSLAIGTGRPALVAVLLASGASVQHRARGQSALELGDRVLGAAQASLNGAVGEERATLSTLVSAYQEIVSMLRRTA